MTMSTAIKAMATSPEDNFMNFSVSSGTTISVDLCVAVVNQDGKNIRTAAKRINTGNPNKKAIGRPDKNLCLKVDSSSLTLSQRVINCMSFSVSIAQNYSITATTLLYCEYLVGLLSSIFTHENRTSAGAAFLQC